MKNNSSNNEIPALLLQAFAILYQNAMKWKNPPDDEDEYIYNNCPTPEQVLKQTEKSLVNRTERRLFKQFCEAIKPPAPITHSYNLRPLQGRKLNPNCADAEDSSSNCARARVYKKSRG